MKSRLMRTGIFGAAVVGPLLLLIMLAQAPVPSSAQYHKGSTLKCADCHTMHYSLRHDFNGGTAPVLGAGGPFPHLLQDDQNKICTNCHDGQTFAPDVVGANTGTAYVREGGALNTAGATGTYADWMGHSLGYTGTAPGGDGSTFTNFSCTHCHNAHGSPNHRNLQGATVTYAIGTNDVTKDVYQRSWTLGQITTNYAVSNVDFNKPTATKSAMGDFCKTCHVNFHGSSTDPNMKQGGLWIRHPSADANLSGVELTQFSNKLNRVKVMSSTGNWGTQGQVFSSPPSDLTPTCLSCHKAHGNKNPFGLIYMSGTGTVTEEGDSGTSLRDMCGQCHTQGN